MHQQARFLTTADGLSLAWAQAGRGMPLVKASNWLTHLRYDWESPVWRHWTEFFAGHFRYIRYDERGCGMTDWEVGDLSFPRWVEDLESVVRSAHVEQPFILVGISQGAATAIAYAERYPQQVSHLVLYGGYARGAIKRGDADSKHLYEAMEELARQGWGKDNPVFRQVFTSRFIPDGTEEQIGWFNDLCRKATTAKIGAELLGVRAEINVADLLPRIRTPTLVLHARDDEVVPFAEGKLLASKIPGATFVELESRNHVLLEHEPAWAHFKESVLDFVGLGGGYEKMHEVLSCRESEILTLLCRGCTNIQIACELGIAEKTVRNHLSRLYEKMGVRSRAEAIVQARNGDSFR
ncbi:MAG: alpha/beta fold hydrolase [Nitrosospira sp.]|nr:alpha/beta fold hydrolase [Nitrosospira sp.]